MMGAMPFASALLSPLGTALALSLLAWLLAFVGHRRGALGLSVMATVWLWIWSLPVAGAALRAHIEGAYPPVPLTQMPQAQAIVILGGAIAPPGPGRSFPNLGAAADRMWHGARLYHGGKAPVVVLSGGSDATLAGMSEAMAMRQFMRDLGVPDSATLLEELSRTTRQNASFTAAMLRRQHIDTVLLVTSALHMERARRHFEAAGLKVYPAATDHEVLAEGKSASWVDWLPDAGTLDGSARAIKEWVGQKLPAGGPP